MKVLSATLKKIVDSLFRDRQDDSSLRHACGCAGCVSLFQDRAALCRQYALAVSLSLWIVGIARPGFCACNSAVAAPRGKVQRRFMVAETLAEVALRFSLLVLVSDKTTPMP